MFFPERIKGMGPKDRVLEIGPGGTPHPRSDVFLEKRYEDPAEAEGQRGYAPPLREQDLNKVVYYDGGRFPFADKAYDYVICSHALEHVEEVDRFLSEITRVGKKGYLEYPTIYYDYLYNFDEHASLLYCRNQVIYWMPKADSGLERFKPVHAFFHETLKKGYSGFVDSLKPWLFQGFEWFGSIESRRVGSLGELTYGISGMDIPAYDSPAKIRTVVSLIKSMLYRR